MGAKVNASSVSSSFLPADGQMESFSRVPDEESDSQPDSSSSSSLISSTERMLVASHNGTVGGSSAHTSPSLSRSTLPAVPAAWIPHPTESGLPISPGYPGISESSSSLNFGYMSDSSQDEEDSRVMSNSSGTGRGAIDPWDPHLSEAELDQLIPPGYAGLIVFPE